MKLNVPNPQQTAVLAGTFLLANAASSVYAAFDVRPSGAFRLLYYVGVAWAFAAWIMADARRMSVTSGFDVDWIAFIAWPLVLPYHLIRTRGFRGLVTLSGFLGLFLATYVVALIIFFAITLLR